jgi:hypothetical protein
MCNVCIQKPPDGMSNRVCEFFYKRENPIAKLKSDLFLVMLSCGDYALMSEDAAPKLV